MVPLLTVEKIEKSFGGNRVLAGVSLAVSGGSAVCIAGKNASGKTTLLKLMAGLLPPDGGTIKADGKIAFVPQEPALLPGLSVGDNLRLWYAAQNKSGPDWSESSIEARMGLEAHRRKKAGALSGGMKKRLSIAAALAATPRWLLLDEPFAALDAAACQDTVRLLCDLKRAGVGIVFTSHEPAHIGAVADELLILRDGMLHPTLPLSDMDGGELTLHILRLLSGELG